MDGKGKPAAPGGRGHAGESVEENWGHLVEHHPRDAVNQADAACRCHLADVVEERGDQEIVVADVAGRHEEAVAAAEVRLIVGGQRPKGVRLRR